ncbi:hypothetical protein SHELI_v1c02630 [Spiroplasma helicoides]|uniref:DivIVA domain-containing protein n=1 Tax=Spiroplasma helicoides TaxID=216938 RepID=A0A1B3SJX2_9MOLU|nr:DivIVA domain-containing protein [Spiroplasma helicoides]AOG60218.1 hypothetical protein SHELI_v1c02630 [Spiroplasma helicoides]
MANYIKLTNNDILNKDFDIEYKGYKVEEVDAFLDVILEDYKVFEEMKKNFEEEKAALLKRNEVLEEELAKTRGVLKLTKEQQEALSREGLSSAQILQRISNLEKKNFDK